MSLTNPPWKNRSLLFGGFVGALLTVFAGCICSSPVGDGLARLSYDVGFNFFPKPPVPDDLIMIYVDDSVKRTLGQPVDQPLNRRFYIPLLDRLTHDGARLALFDLIFDEPSADPEVDVQFADAIRRNGHVVLMGSYEQVIRENSQSDELAPPTAILSSVAPWGVAQVPVDPDYGSRRLGVGTL